MGPRRGYGLEVTGATLLVLTSPVLTAPDACAVASRRRPSPPPPALVPAVYPRGFATYSFATLGQARDFQSIERVSPETTTSKLWMSVPEGLPGHRRVHGLPVPGHGVRGGHRAAKTSTSGSRPCAGRPDCAWPARRHLPTLDRVDFIAHAPTRFAANGSAPRRRRSPRHRASRRCSGAISASRRRRSRRAAAARGSRHRHGAQTPRPARRSPRSRSTPAGRPRSASAASIPRRTRRCASRSR